jgi:hypothetical protein
LAAILAASLTACAAADGGFEGPDDCEGICDDTSTSGPPTDTLTTTDTDTETATDTETDTTAGPDITCTPDCGEHGVCVDVGGEGACECDDGYELDASGCVPCAAAETPFDIDVPVIDVTARVLVDGAPAPASEYDDGNIYLENPRRGDRLHLGNTHDAQLSARILPGIYDVVYEVETPGQQMPVNTHHVLATLDLQTDGDFDVDIPVALMDGTITLAGEDPPASEYDDGQVWLVDGTQTEAFAVANTHDGAVSAHVIEGAYRVHYRVETPGEVVPANRDAFVGWVELRGTELATDIDIPAAPVVGDILINGQMPPVSEYEDGELVLRSEDGDEVVLGNTHDGSFAATVVPGEYDLYYEHETGGAEVPVNRRARIAGLAVNAAEQFDVDIPMVDLDGAITIAGQVPPASEYDDGTVALHEPDTGDVVPLAKTSAGSYAVKIVPGTYEIVYAQETAGAVVPVNTAGRLGQLDVEASMSMDIDVEAVSVTGDITIDGAAPPGNAYASGRLFLRDAEHGDSVLLGTTPEGSYSAVVVPGSYGLYYVEETAGDGVPANQDAFLAPVEVAGAMSFDVDIPSTVVMGGLTVGGEAPPASPGDSGSLYLRAGDDSALLGATHDAVFSIRVVPGSYGIYYRADNAGATVPENTNGRLGCVTLP